MVRRPQNRDDRQIMKKARVIKRGHKKEIRWDLLSSEKVLECIDKLLSGEVISQVLNNCSIGRVANIITEIRKVIGFEAIGNYYLGIGKNQGYILADDDDVVKQKLNKLRDEIKSRIEAKEASKGIKSK